jgi:hypothetical protein
MPFDDKQLHILEPVTLRGHAMKRYHIDQPDQPLTSDVVDAAYAAIEPLMPEPDAGTPAAGWVVVHRGATTGAYVLAYTWVWDNVIELHSAVAGQPVIGCPDDSPTNFIVLGKPWIGCVWELAVLEHERAAWVRYVLDETTPDLDGYLRDCVTDALVGR